MQDLAKLLRRVRQLKASLKKGKTPRKTEERKFKALNEALREYKAKLDLVDKAKANLLEQMNASE